MKIELSYEDGRVTLSAFKGAILVARASGAALDVAVKTLISTFAEYQHEAIEALNASGIIRYAPTEDAS